MTRATKSGINNIVSENVERESTLYTDESYIYNDAHRWMAKSATVRHSANKYVRDDVYTNTIEGVFSIFKRGMKGVYQHCSEKHLHRYLADYDFRYNNRVASGCSDTERANRALLGVVGKRLTYRRTHSVANA